jgi:DNA primase
VCGGGDVVDLVMKVEGLDNRDEAVLQLLDWFGKVDRVDVVRRVQAGLNQIRTGRDGTPNAVTPLYPRVLSHLGVPNYLTSRGFTEETCTQFKAKYDKEKKTVVLPVYDVDGQVVNYAMRATLKDERPRYQYMSGVPKAGQWFGLNMWLGGREVVVVEGPLDAMWVYQQVGRLSFALMGSKMSNEQVDILHYLGIRKVILHLDNDQAGYTGTLQAGELLRGQFLVSMAGYYKPQQDPCDLSVGELQYVYRNTIPMCELESVMTKEE